MSENIFKNMSLFVDGKGYAGKVSELNPPKLTLKMEEFRPGGYDAAVKRDMGMEALECSFSLDSYDADVLNLWGLAPGKSIPITFRGAMESDDGSVKAVVFTMRGQLYETDPGSWKPGDKAQLKGTMTLTYYRQEVGGSVVHEIDIPNFVRTINGVDRLAEQRAALGL